MVKFLLKKLYYIVYIKPVISIDTINSHFINARFMNARFIKIIIIDFLIKSITVRIAE